MSLSSGRLTVVILKDKMANLDLDYDHSQSKYSKESTLKCVLQAPLRCWHSSDRIMRLMIVLLAVISVIFLMIGPTKANKEHPALRSSQHGVHTAAADYWHVIEDIATSNFHSPHHHEKFEDKVTDSIKVNTAIDYRKSTTTVTEIANTAATIKSDTQSQHNSKKVIAYAITVTKDGPFVDGALVLGHAAKKYHGPDYDVDLVAFVAPTVHTSRSVLEKFGWKILERQLPVKIEGKLIEKLYFYPNSN